jgi:hypothetical protein
MKTARILWILALVLLVATIIDIIDGDVPKIISTAALTISLMAFAVAAGSASKQPFQVGGLVFALVAVATFVYRLMHWMQ